jgi:hypothetical protein
VASTNFNFLAMHDDGGLQRIAERDLRRNSGDDKNAPMD